jgi:hypothetical protein
MYLEKSEAKSALRKVYGDLTKIKKKWGGE